MIQIKDKKDCCGCSACVQKCPKQCISMSTDENGFLYPRVDLEKCIDCNICEKVCPMISQFVIKQNKKSYMAYGKDNSIIKKSSSGGIFYELAKYVLQKGGIVFGAKFDEFWNVEHSYIVDIDDIAIFMGSKYLQSKIGNSYKNVLSFLKDGRYVLFTGTPCQILGLKKFLNKEYSNLLTVEIVCHGIPSSVLWKSYLKTLISNENYIKSISFREKTLGWKKYGLRIQEKDDKIVFIPKKRNYFMKAFISNYNIRPSCFNCPAKGEFSVADLVIGDFWGGEKLLPNKYNNLGTSMVIINSDKGNFVFSELPITKIETKFDMTIQCNPAIYKRPQMPEDYDLFWTYFQEFGLQKAFSIIRKNSPSIFKKMIYVFKKIINK